ncbi:hypothetical protein C4588_06115 [Candidatus Parcubacteria bacterium]|nr:MAG: hypothetical protein C4588_06115 [Candidatus Parcubacteria bacterium]
MSKIVGPMWEPPPPGENQWEVKLGGLVQLVNCKSHQQAKKMVLEHWPKGCFNPESFKKAIEQRVKENWRGGLHAKLRMRGDK